jgi:arginine utilization protein RocB
MWRIMTVAAAAALVALTTTGAPARIADDCDAVTKRALREFKSTLDLHKERWVELQGTENESDPVIMQLCSFNKLFPSASAPGDGAKD